MKIHTILILAFSLASCSVTKEVGGDPKNACITFDYTTSGKIYMIIAGKGKATIDWGDGSKLRTARLRKMPANIFGLMRHKGYSFSTVVLTSEVKTVTITGDVTVLMCGGANKYNCEITAVDASRMTGLKWLVCLGSTVQRRNSPVLLNVGGCTALELLNCAHNGLTTLDISGCAALNHVYCPDNRLDRAALSKLVAALPQRTAEADAKICCWLNPGAEELSDEDKATALAKNWTLYIEDE